MLRSNTLSPRFIGYASSPHFVPTLCRKQFQSPDTEVRRNENDPAEPGAKPGRMKRVDEAGRLRVRLRAGLSVCFALTLCPRTLSPRFVGYASSPHFVPTLCQKRKSKRLMVSQTSGTAAPQGRRRGRKADACCSFPSAPVASRLPCAVRPVIRPGGALAASGPWRAAARGGARNAPLWCQEQGGAGATPA